VGENAEEILRETGYSEAEITELRKGGVLGYPPPNEAIGFTRSPQPEEPCWHGVSKGGQQA